MGAFAGQDIVEDGLVLYYDEGNTSSGGNSELISGRSATISSTERRFSQDTLLSTIYSSTAQYNSSAPSPGTGFTFSTWIRRTGATTGTWNELCLIDNGGPRYRMLWFGFFFNETSRVHCSMPYYSATDTSSYWSVDPYWSDAGLTLVQDQWYNFCATYNNSTRVLSTYINGIFALSDTRPGAGDLNNPNGAQVRIFGTNGSSYSNSQVAALTLYNKSLTQQEIQQNFNVLRRRFGY